MDEEDDYKCPDPIRSYKARIVLANYPTKEKKIDAINPGYYKSRGLEAIDIIEAYDLNFCVGNAIKYILRAGKKSNNKTEDLNKAIWYLQREVQGKLE